ncbi:MAG: hypothetical protein ACREES_12150, partial [Stellaceae bacterium]
GVKRFISRALLAALCAVSLSACISSTAPILTDAQPVLGPNLNLQFYTLRKGYASDPDRARFTWNGTRYVHTGGGMTDVSGFTVHPFAQDRYIVQSVSAKEPHLAEYALLYRLADGVYRAVVIDEADADEATRAAHCRHPGGAACRIEMRDALMAFARATDKRRSDDGGLAIRLAD